MTKKMKVILLCKMVTNFISGNSFSAVTLPVVTNSTSGNSFSAVTLPVVTNNSVDHPDDEEDEGDTAI